MANYYDITIKGILKDNPNRFLRLLAGAEEGKIIELEFTETKLRKPDVVFELSDGSLLHLELQSSNDSEMPYRMAEYLLMIAREFKGKAIQQKLLYVGQGKMLMNSTLSVGGLNYHYDIVDIRDIECSQLLSSDSISDVMLAILCRDGDSAETMRAVLARICTLPDNERSDALVRLLQLARLRRIEGLLKKEVDTMPVTVNMEEDIFYKEGIQKGIQRGKLEGKIEGILEGLQDALQLGLEIKYGKDSLQLMPLVKQIRDLEKLNSLKEFLKQTQSLDDMKKQIEIVLKDKTSQ